MYKLQTLFLVVITSLSFHVLAQDPHYSVFKKPQVSESSPEAPSIGNNGSPDAVEPEFPSKVNNGNGFSDSWEISDTSAFTESNHKDDVRVAAEWDLDCSGPFGNF